MLGVHPNAGEYPAAGNIIIFQLTYEYQQARTLLTVS